MTTARDRSLLGGFLNWLNLRGGHFADRYVDHYLSGPDFHEPSAGEEHCPRCGLVYATGVMPEDGRCCHGIASGECAYCDGGSTESPLGPRVPGGL